MAHLSPNIAPLTWARNVGLLSGFLQLTHLFYLIENRWYYVCTYDVLKPQKDQTYTFRITSTITYVACIYSKHKFSRNVHIRILIHVYNIVSS